MPVTALAVTTISRSGVVDTLAAANTDGYTVVNNGKVWVEVANDDATSTNVSFAITQTVDGQTVSPRVVAVAAGVRKKIGPFPVSLYSSSLGVTFSKVTDLTVAAFKI